MNTKLLRFNTRAALIAVLLSAFAIVWAPSAYALSAQGRITAAASTCTSGVCISVSPLPVDTAAIAVQVTGTYVGTLQFEATADGINYSSIPGALLATGVSGTSTTTTGVWIFQGAGATKFRVRCSAYTSGTAFVTIRPTAATAAGGTSVTAEAGLAADDYGTTGSPSAHILTVQGNAAGVAQPISGTVTANLSATDNAVIDDISANQTDASQKTQIVDGSGNVIGATSNALDVNVKSGSTAGTEFAEDAAHTTGDKGTIALAVRNDAGTTLADTTGDYAPLSLNPAGNLNINYETIRDTAPAIGAGAIDGGTPRFTLATDQTAITTAGVFSVKTDQTTHGTTDKVAADLYVAGAVNSLTNGAFVTPTTANSPFAITGTVTAVTTITNPVKAGDGSSWANAELTLAAAVADLPADLTADDAYTIHCAGATADATNVTISGHTTDATHYILIQTDVSSGRDGGNDRHSGKWTNTKYHLARASILGIINIGDNYVRIDGLQIKATSSSASGHSGIYIAGQNATNNNIRISNSIIVSPYTTETNTENGIRINDADAIVDIWNCTVYGQGSVTNSMGIYVTTAATVNIYSCTIISEYIGIYRGAGTVIAKNCYSYGANTAYLGTISKTNCASSDTTADGTNPHVSIALDTDTFVNVTSTTEDYHLAVDGLSPLQEHGIDTTGDSVPLNFTTDIDGDTRSGTWDIGSDEYVAPASSKPSLLQLLNVG